MAQKYSSQTPCDFFSFHPLSSVSWHKVRRGWAYLYLCLLLFWCLAARQQQRTLSLTSLLVCLRCLEARSDVGVVRACVCALILSGMSAHSISRHNRNRSSPSRSSAFNYSYWYCSTGRYRGRVGGKGGSSEYVCLASSSIHSRLPHLPFLLLTLLYLICLYFPSCRSSLLSPLLLFPLHFSL